MPKKNIPPFFRKLLGQINKININSHDESLGLKPPYEDVNYQPTKNGILIYTSRVLKLSHELSHMLEIKNNERLVQLDYGIKKYFPMTPKGQLQAIAREARTRGIQTRLVELAFGNSQVLFHRGAYLFARGFSLGKFKNDQEINDWSAHLTTKSYIDFPKERIIEIWKEKAEFINHWLETPWTSIPETIEDRLVNYRANEKWFSKKDTN